MLADLLTILGIIATVAAWSMLLIGVTLLTWSGWGMWRNRKPVDESIPLVVTDRLDVEG